MAMSRQLLLFFFFNDTATTEIYTLSLHDALPICPNCSGLRASERTRDGLPSGRQFPAHYPRHTRGWIRGRRDRKSTRLNSSHQIISYAVFCLKKKTAADGLTRENGGTAGHFTPV